MEKLWSEERWLEFLRTADIPRYWYGTHGQECSESLLQRKKKQYPSHYKDDRMATYRKHIALGDCCADCVGLLKYGVWSNLGTRKQVYASNGCPDTSADGMFKFAKAEGLDWGTIDTIPERAVCVRYAGHVGYYIGNGIVREWRGFKYGRVDTKLKDRKWTHWYDVPGVDYSANGTNAPISAVGTLGSRLLKYGCKGEDVEMLQRLLMELGYELPMYGADGDFGTETRIAVEDFQEEHGLRSDGQYGERSHAVMMEILAEREAQEDEEDAAPEAVTRHVEVTGPTVNIREGSGKPYEIVTVVKKGALLKLVATADNGWHAVVLPDGRAGWIGPLYSKVVF